MFFKDVPIGGTVTIDGTDVQFTIKHAGRRSVTISFETHGRRIQIEPPKRLRASRHDHKSKRRLTKRS